MTHDTTCGRCGARHLDGFTFLELNNRTGKYAVPGNVPSNESQGLFRFGHTCAKRLLAEAKDVTTP